MDVGGVDRFAELAGQGPIEVGAQRAIREVQPAADPVPKASEVHVLDGALALTGSDQGIILRRRGFGSTKKSMSISYY